MCAGQTKLNLQFNSELELELVQPQSNLFIVKQQALWPNKSHNNCTKSCIKAY